MSNEREKLIDEAIAHFDYGVTHDIFSEPVTTYAKLARVALANIRHVPDTDFGKWIPVDERKPATEKFPDDKEYSEAVNVLTSGNKVITAIWNGADFIGDGEFWGAENETITHWTPVLLPLPEPPKGEENARENA